MPSSSSFRTVGSSRVLASQRIPSVSAEEEGGAVEEGLLQQFLEVVESALAHRHAEEQREEQRRGHREQQAEQGAGDDREGQLLRR
jgi:hypothetical protein